MQPNIPFLKLKVTIEKYMHDMEMKLAGCIGIVISLLQTQKNGEMPMFRTFFEKNLNFNPFFAKKNHDFRLRKWQMTSV